MRKIRKKSVNCRKISFQRLLARKADVSAVNEHGMTPLHYACFWGYVQIAEVHFCLLVFANHY